MTLARVALTLAVAGVAANLYMKGRRVHGRPVGGTLETPAAVPADLDSPFAESLRAQGLLGENAGDRQADALD